MYHETLLVEFFLLTCHKTFLVRKLLGISRKSTGARQAILSKDTVMDCKKITDLTVTEVSVCILLMILNCKCSWVQLKKKPKGYLESNDLYQFLFDQAHASPEEILGEKHEIQYLLSEISPCDSSQVPLSSGQTKSSTAPRQAGTREKRLVGGLSCLGWIS